MYTKLIGDIPNAHLHLVGGKCASLHKLAINNIQVPKGFVIVSTAFSEWIEPHLTLIKSLINQADISDQTQLQEVANNIRMHLKKHPLEENLIAQIQNQFQYLQVSYVAIRSSANIEDGKNASWAGQFESHLQVCKQDIIQSVLNCWLSVFNPRTISYAQSQNVKITDIHMAVIVQEMIPATKSGIAFSTHPITENENEILIEAIHGLGDVIVSGSVTPETHVYHKQTQSSKIITQHKQNRAKFISENQTIELQTKVEPKVLTQPEITKLANIITQIEQTYNHPCDIEWCIQDENIYIVQSRPITTLKNLKVKPHDYKKSFVFRNLKFNVADNAMCWYKKHDFLAIYHNDTLYQYLTHTAIQKALEEGKTLITNSQLFETFANDFRIAITESDAFIKHAKNRTEVTPLDLINLRSFTKKLYYFFEKTEFLYTDKCFEEEMTQTTKDNLFILGDELKMKGRTLMLELLTSIPYHYAKILSQKTDIPIDWLKSYSHQELMDLVTYNQRVVDEVIEQRLKCFIVYSKNGTVHELKTDEHQDIINAFIQEEKPSSTIKGTTANPGKVTAKAFVVEPEYDEDYDAFVKKVEQMNMPVGSILVTETTSPDFVPLMRRAGGIIANQGGLNSHAAIMSRELKIPCIVGTENGTEKLKTGDLVELDAHAGVANILEKSE